MYIVYVEKFEQGLQQLLENNSHLCFVRIQWFLVHFHLLFDPEPELTRTFCL